MEEDTEYGNDPRRLLLVALSVLALQNNRLEPCPEDIQFLKDHVEGKETTLSPHNLASIIIQRESSKNHN